MSTVGKSSALRMSGLNSGLDTEAIVNAMTAATKLKITTNQRKVLKLEAQQEAYRGVIDKVQAFKDKYFDILNSGSYLKGATGFNKYSAKVSTGGVEKTPSGVKVSTNSGAIPGNYKVEVKAVATQAKYSGQALDSMNDVDLSNYSDANATYAMKVTVGGTSKVISFKGGSEEAVQANINKSLEAFGKTNDGAGTVSVKKDSDGKYIFNSLEKKAITTSNGVELKDSLNLGVDFVKGFDEKGSGTLITTSTINVTIDGQTMPLKLTAMAQDSFDRLFTDQGKGFDERGIALGKDDTDQLFQDSLYMEFERLVKEGPYKDYLGEQYASFIDADDYYKLTGSYEDDWDNMSDAQKDVFQSALTAKQDEQWAAKYKTEAEAAYDKLECSKLGSDEYIAFNVWMETDGNTLDDFKAASGAFEGREEVVVAEAEMFYNLGYHEYEAYVTNGFDGLTADEFIEQYKTDNGANSGTAITGFVNPFYLNSQIENLKFSDGTKLEANYSYAADGSISNIELKAYTEDTEGNKTYKQLAATFDSGTYNFGFEDTKAISNTLSTSTKISELGLTPDVEATYDADGKMVSDAKYNMNINGVDFSFDGSMNISSMMSYVNSSKANVTMAFSSLTNKFEITTKDYGVSADIKIDESNPLLSALGFGGGSFTGGSNLKLDINGVEVETASNSYTVDGTTFSFNSLTEVGTKFEVEVSRDMSKITDLVKDFVKDYNELIKHVYDLVDDKPNKDYHFLTDDDKDEMELSDRQEEMWETAAKKGILYNDNTLITMMSKFRTALYSASTGVEGNGFGLYSMGITTTSDYKKHGMLQIDEDKLTAAFETNFDDVVKLFTNSTNGIMTQFDTIIDQSIKRTGEAGARGTLIDKAGVANGTSTTNNVIYNQIKSLNSVIASLEKRYEQQQDRYWSVYTALEKQMGSLNGQTSYINQLMGM